MIKYLIPSQALRQRLATRCYRAILVTAGIHCAISPVLAGIFSETYVNLLTSDDYHTSSTASSSVSSHSYHSITANDISDGQATADTSANLGASVESKNVGLSYLTAAQAQFSSGFSAYNSSLGAYLPPGTSVVLSGGMFASSDCSDPQSISATLCSYRMYTSGHDYPGTIYLRSHGGIPTITRTGAPLAGTVRVAVTPTVKVFGGDYYHLNEIDLGDTLGLSYDLWDAPLEDFDDANFSVLATTIATAIFNSGLSSIGALAGTDVDVGFDVTLDLTNAAEFDIGLTSGIDNFTNFLYLSAQSTFDANCNASFTFKPQ
jgi:hypothetical protein